MAMAYCTYCDRYFDTDEEDHARYEYPLPIKCGACVEDEEFEEKQKQDWMAIDMDWEWIENNW